MQYLKPPILVFFIFLSSFGFTQVPPDLNKKQQDLWQLFQLMKGAMEEGMQQTNVFALNPEAPTQTEQQINQHIGRELDNLFVKLMPAFELHLSHAQIKLMVERMQKGQPFLDIIRHNFHLLTLYSAQTSIVWMWDFMKKITQINEVGTAYYKGNYSEALKVADVKLAKDPKDAISLFYKGLTLRDSLKQPEIFLEYANKAIELKPDFHMAYYQRSGHYLMADKFELAKQDIDSALVHWGEFPDYLCHKARVFYLMGEKYAAENQLDKLLELDENYEPAYRLRGFIHREKKRYDLAVIDFSRSIALDSTDFYVVESRAFTYMKIKKYKKALEGFEKVLTMNLPEENRIYTYNNIGHVKYKMGHYDEALKHINYSLSQDAKNSYAYKNRALVYLAQGKELLACADLQKALDLGYTQKYGKEVEELLAKYSK